MRDGLGRVKFDILVLPVCVEVWRFCGGGGVGKASWTVLAGTRTQIQIDLRHSYSLVYSTRPAPPPSPLSSRDGFFRNLHYDSVDDQVQAKMYR